MNFVDLEKKGLIFRTNLKATELMKNYPPIFMNRNKKWIYTQILEKKNPPEGSIAISRWNALQIPFLEDFIPPLSGVTEIKTHSGYFSYEIHLFTFYRTTKI